jgi:hypothetical protein
MVDFRYHLISLIAVILALALGILAGSGFLGGPLLERLRTEVSDLADTNGELRREIDNQDDQLAAAEGFARASAPLLTQDALSGEEVVVIQFTESDGRLIEGVKSDLTGAGAEVVAEVSLAPKFALNSAPFRDELSLIVGSVTGDRDVILEDAATLLGQRMGAVAVDPSQLATPSGGVAVQRLETLIQDLERAEFIGTSGVEDGRLVPAGATFVVIGGSGDRPPFDAAGFVTPFVENLTERGAAAMVVENQTTTWGLVAAVRADIEARARASTVDNGDTTIGRIAVVLGLDRSREGVVGHYGVGPQRTEILPELDPSG